jgi:hypothetical protein
MRDNNRDPNFEDDYTSGLIGHLDLRSNPLSKRCRICHRYFLPESRFARFCETCFEEQELSRFDNEGNSYAI